MALKTLLFSSFFVFSLVAGEFTSDVIVDEVEDISDFGPSRNRRASEGDITHLKKIIIDNDKLPGVLQPDGSRCVKKIFYVNETEFERGMECQHRLKKKCHLTYVTDYHPAPEKRCETTFRKNCHITFKNVPHTEKIRKCHIPYEKNCGPEIVGPTVCKTVYETSCETKFKTYNIEQDEPDCKTVEELRCTNKTIELLHLPHKQGQERFAVKERCEKWPVQKCDLNKKTVEKVHPDTECTKTPRKVCAPSNCEVIPGPEICHDEVVTQVQRVPEEECDLEPQENCRTESTLVPKLVPKKNCVHVPKEICVNKKQNPRTVTKPVIKNWCYNPSDLNRKLSD